MIEITHPKLIALKEYMELKIDDLGGIAYINFEMLPDFSAEEILKLYFNSGIFLGNHKRVNTPVRYEMTFEEFYNSKMNNHEPS